MPRRKAVREPWRFDFSGRQSAVISADCPPPHFYSVLLRFTPVAIAWSEREGLTRRLNGVRASKAFLALTDLNADWG